jgi:galactokinase
MWQIQHLPQDGTGPDVERLLSQLNTEAKDFFMADAPILIGRAPGRLDLMGGIADYSGSLVLEMPLAVSTMAAIQYTDDPVITICSTLASEIEGDPMVTIPLSDLTQNGTPLTYQAANRLLTHNASTAWAAYIVGVLIVLQKERHLKLARGLRILINCEVPIGKGVSSSAALEVAVMTVINAAFHLSLTGREIALLCQKVENLVVGAPCGIMDQMTSACGEQNSLLALLCQPAELQSPVPLPEEIEIWGIDSGVRHAVSGADYGSVRVGAFMGYPIIADLVGLTARQGEQQNTVTIEDPYWQGYLANLTPSLWEAHYREQIPVTLTGAAFLERYSGSTDTITHIDPEKQYAVRLPTAHPIYEHHRVQLFRRLLSQPQSTDDTFILLGEIMYQAHNSYNSCGMGSQGTDHLVNLVRQAGTKASLYGAKITGGGSGGTVAVLARKGADRQIHQIAATYEQETGRKTVILNGSSSGADSWGTYQLTYV